ncbi:hypothetical protein PsalN5692_04117 (plasmid) [Piscirickettsia salmonis]|nr:hypothetical protein PsalN5692_03800 [Piscirickettsia salmonis]QGP52608.1 hypothetical protein PsalN5692_04117 [Piscirickettsia salmonis]QGP63332.1 hypothetical protein PsalMR5_01187 [Piscirickettsia salmonis]
MSNDFINKVQAERRVLSAINKKYSKHNQLSGLSYSTIQLWCQKRKIPPNSNVSASIIKLADLCNSLSGRSHENFIDVPINTLKSIKIMTIALTKILPY